jgi:hypothetical protein
VTTAQAMVRLDVWEAPTASVDDWRAGQPASHASTAVALVTYDVSDATSLELACQWTRSAKSILSAAEAQCATLAARSSRLLLRLILICVAWLLPGKYAQGLCACSCVRAAAGRASLNRSYRMRVRAEQGLCARACRARGCD